MIVRMQKLIVEYLRPWKLTTLAIGIGLLLIGADYQPAPDWDYSISFIMASLTYLTAPWSVQVLRSRRWRWLPLALLVLLYCRWLLLAVLVQRQSGCTVHARSELLCLVLPLLVVRLHLAARWAAQRTA